MSNVIYATPGLTAYRREAALPLSSMLSWMVMGTTTMSLLALATLVPSGLAMVLLGVFVFLAVYSKRKKVPAPLRFALFVSMVVFVSTQGLGLTSEAGTGLLMACMIIKQAETRTSRDASTMLLFNIIAPFTAMLQNQDPLVMGVSLLALFFGLTASLAQSESSTKGSKGLFLRTFVVLLLVSPFAVLSYLLIPRLDAPLWISSRNSSKTGVSESMNVSSWQRVMNDYSTAFRVHYEGRPPVGQQYYRGYVLWSFNGRAWERNPIDPLADVMSSPPGDPTKVWAHYQINYEDRSLQRLFLLDYPAGQIPGVRLSSSGEASWANTPRSRVAAMAAEPLPQQLSSSQRLSALSIPEGTSPRLQKMVSELRARYSDDMEFARAALRQFDGFSYSLSPGRLDSEQPVDSFMFDVREGFCVHYSSAYALMLRMAGIPSRVVNGYASSEMSDLGDYYRVRQADAHSWVEAWIGNRWVRFDPTSQSSSARTQQMSWGQAWRNSGYEMSDWFKSYWDRWISYYDAGAQEKTIDTAQKALSSLSSKILKNPVKVSGFVVLALLSWFVLSFGISCFRSPSAHVILHKWVVWLDKHAPSVYPGQPLADRLNALPWLPTLTKNEGLRYLNLAQRMVFDPSTGAGSSSQRRDLNRNTTRLFALWGRMKKNPLLAKNND